VFGVEGAQFDRLQQMLPKAVALGSMLAIVPIPQWDWGQWSPWGRFFEARRQYDLIVDELIAAARADPNLAERRDVLAVMLQSRYDDGSEMNRDEIADQLVTLLTAGYETTATTLAWAVERLRRHPELLGRLVDEIDAGSDELLDATILEVQRSRPVIDTTFRSVVAPSYQLGPWLLPQGQTVLIAIGLMHDNDALFADHLLFNPDRFVGARPDNNEWIPYGGGARRCIGAAFASMELKVVLRAMLREFRLVPTTDRDERWRSRGVALAPAKGGRVVVTRRQA
jgi:cytochrome P450